MCSVGGMATGRGQFFQSLMQGLERIHAGKLKEAKFGWKASRGEHSQIRRQESEFCRTLAMRLSPVLASSEQKLQTVSSSCENYIDRLPSEIILKIFSYLDAASLMCVSGVNRHFYKLANDNELWYGLYTSETSRKKRRPNRCGNAMLELQLPPGFWKKQLLKELGCYEDAMWKKELKVMNVYTGMPQRTKQVLSDLKVSWEITLTKKNEDARVYKQSQTFFSDSSVSVCWSSRTWPRMHHVRTLELHGIIHPPGGALAGRPRWRSLISRTVCAEEKWRNVGMDGLMKLIHFNDEFTVGVWRGTWIIAFVMVNLHFHKLVERSLLGSLFCPYRSEGLSPVHNELDCSQVLRHYTINILLHNAVRNILQHHYYPVSTVPGNTSDRFVQFRPVSFFNTSEHIPVTKKISFPWMAGGIHGDIENSCVMTLSVLDEGQTPLWCVCSPVSLSVRPRQLQDEYHGVHFALKFGSADGEVHMRFVKMREFENLMLIGLNVLISTTKINKHLRTRGCSSSD